MPTPERDTPAEVAPDETEPTPPTDGEVAGVDGGVRGLAGRHPKLVIGWAVVGLVVALLATLLRPPTYVAESRLLVGTFEVPSEAIPGYVLASESLAENYERLAETELVVGQVADQLGISTDDVRGNISVTAIPDSAILRVEATDGDEEQARAMAEAMANGIDVAVEGLAVRTDSDEVLARFEEASQELVAAELEQGAALAALTQARASGGAAAITSAQEALNQAELALATAELTAQGLADEYIQTQQRTSSSSGVRTLGGATVSEASSLVSTLVTVALGILAGAGVGLALAWRRDRLRPSAAGRHDEDEASDLEVTADSGESSDAAEPDDADAPYDASAETEDDALDADGETEDATTEEVPATTRTRNSAGIHTSARRRG